MTMTDQDNRLLEALQAFVAGPAPVAAAPVIPDAVTAQARELDDLRTAIKVLKEREDALRTSLLDYLATEDVDSVTDGVVSISRHNQERSGIDRKRMEALYPKVLANCATSTPVTQLRVEVKG